MEKKKIKQNNKKYGRVKSKKKIYNL